MKPSLLFSLLLTLVSFNVLSQESNPDPADTTSAFEKVEVEASYPGGVDAWRKFLERTLNPSVPVDNGSPIGIYTVYVQFMVDKNGIVSGIRPLTNLGYGMEQEVVRVMKRSEPWVPAIQKGKPVNAYRKQPVTFSVEDDDINIVTSTPFTFFTKTANELTIEVRNVKNENLDLSISQGSIVPSGEGKYIVRINKPGRVIVYIKHKKKNKNIGEASFEVRSE